MSDDTPPDARWFERILQSAEHIAIVSFDADAKIVTWNSGAERLFLHSASDAVGCDGQLIFTPEDIISGDYQRELKVAAMEGHALDDRWHQRGDGSRFWASGMLMAVRNDAGIVDGFVKIVQDKTDWKRLEDELRASEEQFARVFLGNPAPIAVERADDGVLMLANERFFQVTGYWRSELIGRPVAGLGLWADVGHRERIVAALQAGGAVESEEVEVVRKGGDRARLLASFALAQFQQYPCVVSTYLPVESGG